MMKNNFSVRNKLEKDEKLLAFSKCPRLTHTFWTERYIQIRLFKVFLLLY